MVEALERASSSSTPRIVANRSPSSRPRASGRPVAWSRPPRSLRIYKTGGPQVDREWIDEKDPGRSTTEEGQQVQGRHASAVRLPRDDPAEGQGALLGLFRIRTPSRGSLRP